MQFSCYNFVHLSNVNGQQGSCIKFEDCRVGSCLSTKYWCVFCVEGVERLTICELAFKTFRVISSYHQMACSVLGVLQIKETADGGSCD